MATKDKKNVLITGGAGFMGRWVSKNLVNKGHRVWILDNLSNSSEDNIEEFRSRLAGFAKGDIKDRNLIADIFGEKIDICIHMAAVINVQESIDNPRRCLNDNVIGLFNIFEECRKNKTKLVFISSALIYKTACRGEAIKETHPLNFSCPYTVSKIFGENTALSYYKTYGLPVVILRPFSIYGPWQKSNSEGGVMSIFIARKLKSQPLEIYGSGEQGRDFFYIEDCAEFISRAAFSNKAVGEIFNVGSGKETKIKKLAELIAGNNGQINFVRHHHTHAEIMSMRADCDKAKKILNWQAKISLDEGIAKTKKWLTQRHRER